MHQIKELLIHKGIKIMRTNRWKRAAFTLIELLVVIAIIAMLAGLLLPALNAARIRSYDADCMSNLRNIGTALYQYATMNHDLFPVVTTADAGGDQSTLLNALAEQIDTNSTIWFCKRYAKEEHIDYLSELENSRIGYYYWAWEEAGGSIYQVDAHSTSNYWNTKGLSTNLPGMVLASDRFQTMNAGDSSDVQYHAGTSLDAAGEVSGTIVLLSEGATMKIAPSP